MGIKEWLFGKEKKGQTDNKAEAIQKLKKQLNSLEVEGRNQLRKSDEEKIAAKSLLRSGNKIGAKQALTRSSLYAQRYNQIQNMSLNLSTQIDTISTAQSTSETVSALKIGSEVIEETLTQISPADVERTMVEMEDQRERISFMTDSLSDVSGLEIDLDGDMVDAIDDQLASLELEMESESHGALPTAATTTISTPESSVKTGEDTSDLEKDLKDLEKDLDDSD
ncbi:MAG: hypothetical protein HeimC2_12340 [Candidatus Heimdallarchaeota archaeon LC_2]|nr:MAG: hypothetical protein HeimC2_12340 [Candidatus Heimdallarchaeota archaeon LC_2]